MKVPLVRTRLKFFLHAHRTKTRRSKQEGGSERDSESEEGEIDGRRDRGWG